MREGVQGSGAQAGSPRRAAATAQVRTDAQVEPAQLDSVLSGQVEVRFGVVKRWSILRPWRFRVGVWSARCRCGDMFLHESVFGLDLFVRSHYNKAHPDEPRASVLLATGTTGLRQAYDDNREHLESETWELLLGMLILGPVVAGVVWFLINLLIGD